MSAPLLAGFDLTFSYLGEGERPILSKLAFRCHKKKYGLVGDNGSGKTTLFRLLRGTLTPTAGHVEVYGKVGYLPQDAHLDEEATVAEIFGLAATLDALAAVTQGLADPAHFEAIGDDWDAEERAVRALARVGLPSDLLLRSVGTLSGGQTTRVRLAALLLEGPQFLILDEPTNHLDAEARKDLMKFLADWQGGVLVASHDRALLAAMDETWELGDGKLRVYGGGYEFYRTQRAAEIAAAAAAVQAAANALDTTRSQASETLQRQARRTASARRSAPNAGLPKILLGARKRRAQETAGQIREVHEGRVAAAEERLSEARERVVAEASVQLDLPETAVPKGKLTLRIDQFNVRLPDGSPLWRTPLDAVLTGPRRLAIAGPNGSGKSLLLRALAGLPPPGTLQGSASCLAGPVAFLDQHAAAIDRSVSVLENFRRCSPKLPETERRIRLGRMLFEGDKAHAIAESLSGGEIVRLNLACALLGDRAAKVVLLDEPTNHLDRGSIEHLEQVLRSYAGVLLVASHDATFLAALDLDGEWRLSRA